MGGARIICGRRLQCQSCWVRTIPEAFIFIEVLPVSVLLQFSEGRVAPPGARIVYVDGAFDLFHPGHVDFLKVLPPMK